MAVMRWDPWGELAVLQRDVNQLLGRPAARQAAPIIPALDAFRTSDGMSVRMELPGMRADEVEVSVSEGVLSIAGERKLDASVAEDAWIVRERAVGRFERSITLPKDTDASAITAAFTDGILELTIPAPPERRPHKVSISAAKPAGETVDVG
jgi:HSP20 family protein